MKFLKSYKVYQCLSSSLFSSLSYFIFDIFSLSKNVSFCASTFYSSTFSSSVKNTYAFFFFISLFWFAAGRSVLFTFYTVTDFLYCTKDYATFGLSTKFYPFSYSLCTPGFFFWTFCFFLALKSLWDIAISKLLIS